MNISLLRTGFLLSALLTSGWLVSTSSAVAIVNPPGFPAFGPGEYVQARLGSREPDIQIEFPGGALSRGLSGGSAAVSVLVDAQGKAVDAIVTAYTDPAFGKALYDHVQSLSYDPAKLKGTPVPSRVEIGYRFTGTASIDAMQAARNKFDSVNGAPVIFSATPESKLDHPLEFTNVALPKVPVGYPTVDDKPVKVFVTFYIDQEGQVHAPNVESSASPALVAGAIKAVRQWTFKPATAGGKTVLVFAGKSVGFVPRNP